MAAQMCQIRSTELSSGLSGGSSNKVILPGTTSPWLRCQPARSRITTAWVKPALAKAGGGDLATDLAEMMVHGGGIADGHDQRCRFALHWADRTKHIGRGEAEVLWCRRPAAGLPPHPGQTVLLTDARLVLKPHLDPRAWCLPAPDSL